MKDTLLTDFDNIQEGSNIRLYPNESNPLHKAPIEAHYSGGYYYCKGSDPHDGPDYYFRDVVQYNKGYELIKKDN